ncbi:MAG: diacylglycerol kinase family lipid kinase [Chloroflexi bacterium]|nr:MAG: diacylglycerol kinase family lipid kinase [Chloroflexota bacterium]
MGKGAVKPRSEGRHEPERGRRNATTPSEILLIVNPAAGAGRVLREWPRLAAEIRGEGIEFEETFTSRPGEATEIARKAVKAGRPVVAAVGGDGILYEVVNGFFEGGEPLPTRSSLGLIPFGTGSDTRRSFGIPDGLPAARVLVEGRARALDAGRVTVGGRVLHFLNVAEAGIGADVSDRVNRAPKTFGGRASFLIGTLQGLAAWKHKPMKVVIDGRETRELVAQAVTVANCQYYGSGMRVAPRAIPDDGLFDVLISGAFGKLEGLSGLRKIYAGAHLDDPKLASKLEFFRATRVEVSSPVPVLVQLDGEVVGELPALFELLPKALRFLTPA